MLHIPIAADYEIINKAKTTTKNNNKKHTRDKKKQTKTDKFSKHFFSE